MVGTEVWVKFFLWQMVGTNLGKYECVWKEKLWCLNSTMQKLNARWWNSRWVHYHQVKWEWMILSQNELVRVRIRVEGECFWVNLREDNKVSEFQQCTVSESKMAEFKMAAIIKFSENQWMKVLVWVQNQSGGTNLGKYEWVWKEDN